MNARKDGKSEFVPIDQFVINKNQYEMVQSLQFFNQFRLNKYFGLWKCKSVKQTFKHRLENFQDICWEAKNSFTPINLYIRKKLQSFKNKSLFPMEDDGLV